jgi:PAS domain S-box-containing protein
VYIQITGTEVSEKMLDYGGFNFKSFVDCSPVATFVLDLNHCIAQWNRACEDVLGFSSDFMVGTKNQWMPF